jgi:hypothetical protein
MNYSTVFRSCCHGLREASLLALVFLSLALPRFAMLTYLMTSLLLALPRALYLLCNAVFRLPIDDFVTMDAIRCVDDGCATQVVTVKAGSTAIWRHLRS